jgi:DNA repair exonuclease SbcCD ATPase subunit
MNRQMFTSHPPVKPEVDEKNRADVLHASAIAMAKKMYDQQQRIIDSSARAQHGHARTSSLPGGPADTESLSSSRNEDQQAPSVAYGSLQEAAYRLAQERLAKLQEEHQKQRSLQDHYAAPPTAPPHRSRLGSIKSKLTRKRSSSDGDLPVEDRQRSDQIRRQMSLLNNRLSEVDGEKEKRAQDRKALLAAAQRNVKAQLHAMDAKVQSDTGRVPQVSMDDWGRKALVAARARFDASNENAGKVDLGGGKFMDRSEVERIAAGRVQPLLDEINEKAEKEQERQEEERLAEERRKEEAERDRMREQEIQEIHKKLKGWCFSKAK